jgi:molecular chaperone GrpE
MSTNNEENLDTQTLSDEIDVTQSTTPEVSVKQDTDEREYTVDELKLELTQAKQLAQDNWDKMLRIQAEMENLKRRTQKDVEDAHKFGLSKFVGELLPVLDSLHMGLQAAVGENDDVKRFREGCELTIKQFESAFEKFNVVILDPIGLPFNAEHHQAMVMQATEGVEPNTVVNVFQKGYLLNGRLIRPAMVVVSKKPD